MVKDSHSKKQSYEFGGSLGATAMVFSLPILVLFFACCCGPSGYPSQELYSRFTVGYLVSLYSFREISIYCGFIALMVLLYKVLPGDIVQGTLLRNGARLQYRMNGLITYITIVSVSFMLLNIIGIKALDYVYDHYAGLAIVSILFSYTVSSFVYFNSFKSDKLLALRGNTGNTIYDFMIGRELNPHVGSVDIKFFTELRGLIIWLIINYCLAAKQYTDLGHITKSMALVQLLQSWYVLDALWNEKAIVTTRDITTDGFGFMLAFGLYAWVPFTYTLQARYLVDFPHTISWLQFFSILFVNALGYYIFRGANSQKNAFRMNPNGSESKHLSYIKTKSGSKLITSGWWGMSRHINYFGDWLMAISWSLPCGFGSVIPYFYPIYFAILLLHREKRDDHKCRVKYGKDWERYCESVPYRIIPGIY